MWNIGKCTLRHFKRTNIYKNSTGSCKFDPTQIEAWSYRWWKFVKKENGLVIFNNYNYSPSTSAHQSAVRSLMRDLKIKVDVTVYSSDGLQDDWKKEVYTDIYEKIFLNEYKSTKKGLSNKTKQNCLWLVKQGQKDLKKLSKVKCPLTKKDLKNLKERTIRSYETDLAEKRAEAKELREKRKNLITTVKKDLNSLEPLKNYDNFDKMNELKSI